MAAHPDLFKEALSALPSGVTVITTTNRQGVPCGATVSAFMSLSLNPPLVLMSLAKGSSTGTAVRESGAFVAHVVGDVHRDLAMHFASNRPDKFEGLRHRRNEKGSPILAQFGVRIECSLHAEYPGGDHDIFVGFVNKTGAEAIVEPAVWYSRSFHGLRKDATSTAE